MNKDRYTSYYRKLFTHPVTWALIGIAVAATFSVPDEQSLYVGLGSSFVIFRVLAPRYLK